MPDERIGASVSRRGRCGYTAGMNARRLAIAILLLLLLPLAACGNKGDLVRPPPDGTGTEAAPVEGEDSEDDSDAPPPVDDADDDGTAPSVDMLPSPDIDDIEEDDSGNDDTDGGGG